jgi:hypothetical protein
MAAIFAMKLPAEWPFSCDCPLPVIGADAIGGGYFDLLLSMLLSILRNRERDTHPFRLFSRFMRGLREGPTSSVALDPWTPWHQKLHEIYHGCACLPDLERALRIKGNKQLQGSRKLSDLEALMNESTQPTDPASRWRAYAGIGSRDITSEEAAILRGLGKRLADLGYWLYSGNAVGADQAFEEGAGAKAVAFLPGEEYNPEVGREAIRCKTITDDALRIARELHPKGSKLSPRTRLLMARNVQIVDGIPGYPPVEFVLCCADPRHDGVAGGSAMAYRVARRRGIPFINIREVGWNDRLRKIVGLDGALMTSSV